GDCSATSGTPCTHHARRPRADGAGGTVPRPASGARDGSEQRSRYGDHTALATASAAQPGSPDRGRGGRSAGCAPAHRPPGQVWPLAVGRQRSRRPEKGRRGGGDHARAHAGKVRLSTDRGAVGESPDPCETRQGQGPNRAEAGKRSTRPAGPRGADRDG